MLKLKEIKQLAEILGERLQDKNPDEQLILKCLDPIWPYIYPFGMLSYIKKHSSDPPEKINRAKVEKLTRVVTGSPKKWRSFIIGLCHTYRERHSLKRTGLRLVNRALKKGSPGSVADLANLAGQFRKQARACASLINELKAAPVDSSETVDRINLAKTIRNDENIPRFLRLSRYLKYDRILALAPAEVLAEFKSRYEKPNPQTLSFDALQEYICFRDDLWKKFEEMLVESFQSAK